MKEWHFVRDKQGCWSWQLVEDGRVIRESYRCFRSKPHCVRDARANGYSRFFCRHREIDVGEVLPREVEQKDGAVELRRVRRRARKSYTLVIALGAVGLGVAFGLASYYGHEEFAMITAAARSILLP